MTAPVLSTAEQEAVLASASQCRPPIANEIEMKIYRAGWLACREWAEERHVQRMAPAIEALAEVQERGRAINEDAVIAAAAAELLRDCEGDKTLAKLRWVDNEEAEEWIEDTRETIRAYRAALASPTPQETGQAALYVQGPDDPEPRRITGPYKPKLGERVYGYVAEHTTGDPVSGPSARIYLTGCEADAVVNLIGSLLVTEEATDDQTRAEHAALRSVQRKLGMPPERVEPPSR